MKTKQIFTAILLMEILISSSFAEKTPPQEEFHQIRVSEFKNLYKDERRQITTLSQEEMRETEGAWTSKAAYSPITTTNEPNTQFTPFPRPSIIEYISPLTPPIALRPGVIFN